MTKTVSDALYHDFYEYHGNTAIEFTRKQGGITVFRDWILFDSVDEAGEYFNENCCVPEASWTI